MVEGKNRLIGSMPKIGIRPVIDGRERGVRVAGGADHEYGQDSGQIFE